MIDSAVRSCCGGGSRNGVDKMVAVRLAFVFVGWRRNWYEFPSATWLSAYNSMLLSMPVQNDSTHDEADAPLTDAPATPVPSQDSPVKPPVNCSHSGRRAIPKALPVIIIASHLGFCSDPIRCERKGFVPIGQAIPSADC
jgi:hypothetical protein